MAPAGPFCQKQQMQWSKPGAHLRLQTRVKTRDGELGAIFKRWYPDMDIEGEAMPRRHTPQHLPALLSPFPSAAIRVQGTMAASGRCVQQRRADAGIEATIRP